MKNIYLISFLFSTVLSFGAGISDDLPKPVLRTLNSIFGKENVILKEKDFCKQGLPGDKFYSIHASGINSQAAGYLHVGRVKTCRTGGCSLPGSSNTNFEGEYFDYLIIFNASIEVEIVRIFNYQASYGHEIAARGWLKQFEGFNAEESLEPGKNIDSISGATISVHAITNDIKWKTKTLKELILEKH